MSLPVIAIIGMGGTIAMSPADSGSPIVPNVDLSASIDVALQNSTLAPVKFQEVCRSSSSSLDFATLRTALVRAEAAVDDGAEGVVICQGTDTIEETSYFWHLHWRHSAPLVVTGAMRHHEEHGFDGSRNLVLATAAARTPGMRDLGCVVAIDDTVHLAADVRKVHTSSVSAFTSPSLGAAGHYIEGQIIMTGASRPWPDKGFSMSGNHDTAPIAALYVGLGDDGSMIDAVPDHYRGAILIGMGGGHVPAKAVPKIAKLAERMPVVLTTRVERGPVLSRTYGYPGSETDLVKNGVILSGFLGTAKSAILLRALLALGKNAREIRGAFAEAGRYELV